MHSSRGTSVAGPKVVPIETHVVEIENVIPPDAECPIGMDILGCVDGVHTPGKIVSTTWPRGSQKYIAVFANGTRFAISLDQVLALHENFVNTPGTRPIRVVIEDKDLAEMYPPNEEDMLTILDRAPVSPKAFVWYVDAEIRSPVSVSVAKEFEGYMHVGICFGRHTIEGRLVYLIMFCSGRVEGMSCSELMVAASRFEYGGYVPIRAVL